MRMAVCQALPGQPGLLASLTDNFTGFAIHRQNAPETRDWLAKLMGTTALWQSTDQPTGHGSAHMERVGLADDAQRTCGVGGEDRHVFLR